MQQVHLTQGLWTRLQLRRLWLVMQLLPNLWIALWPTSAHINEDLAKLWNDHVRELKGVNSPALQISCAVLASPPLAVKAVSGSLPLLSPVASVLLPFGSAVIGRHFKADLPRPEVSSNISADADIHCWLLWSQEYCTLAGNGVSLWAVIAGRYLDKVPLQLWGSTQGSPCCQRQS